MKKLGLEILPNGKRYTLFLFCLIIKKIEAKFLVGEN
jgi:hypothetical protein